MRYSLVDLLFEQDVEDELHVFDFDDTLGITNSPTLVAAVEFTGGDPDDSTNYQVVTNLSDRLRGTTGTLRAPSEIDYDTQGISGNKVSGENSLIDGAEVVVVDTAQYRDWKEKYIRGGSHARVVVGGDVGKKIRDAAKQMEAGGETGEIHVVDFSPSSTLGTVKPISPTLQRLKDVEMGGGETAVVTARKGDEPLDTFGGRKQKAQNAQDIKDFLQNQIGATPGDVFGAADISNATSANKRKLVKWLVSKHDPDEIHFYDDDPENIQAVGELCDDPDLENREIHFYNAEFEKEGIPIPDVCTPQLEGARWLVLAGLLKS